MQKKKYMGRGLTENGRAPGKRHVKGASKSYKAKAKKADSSAELRALAKRAGAHRSNWNRVPTDNFHAWNGFFRKNLGKKWDDVFSELVERLKGEGDMHRDHAIRIHLDHTVETDVIMIDGVPHHGSAMYYGYISINGFYVHPETGLLCFREYEKWPRQKPHVEKFLEDGKLKYELKADTWYVYGEGGATIPGKFNYKTGEFEVANTVRPLNKKELEFFYSKHPRARRV